MKQKGLLKIIVLLLGCFALTGWSVWTEANKIFPVQEDEIEYVFVKKEEPVTTNVYKPLDEQQRVRLINMLNQCQWKDATADSQRGDFRIVSGVEQIVYEVKLNYRQNEWMWRKNSAANLLIDKNNRVIAEYGGFEYYTDTSGNYDTLLELLEEQHFYCHEQHSVACQREHGLKE